MSLRFDMYNMEISRNMEISELLRNYDFLRHALLACILASIGCGIIGSFVVVERMSMISGGLAHSVFGGMGIAYYFGASPMSGAWTSAVLAALLIAYCRTRWRQREDVLIAALWSLGMAIGVIFISRAGGSNVDLFSYLFGNILLIEHSDLLLMFLLDIVIVSIVWFAWNPLLSVTFDPEHARLRGIRVAWMQALLLVLIALVIVLLLRIAGLILAVCLISIPAATAVLFARSLQQMIGISCLLCLLSTCTGLGLSIRLDLPAAAVMVILSCVFYLSALCVRR